MEKQTNDGEGYRISRKPDQADDSLDSFEWKPAKESDELYEALKIAFPRGTTHRYRMRDALIDFLLQEREAERESQRIAVSIVKSSDQENGPGRTGLKVNFHENSSRGLNSRPPYTIQGDPTPPETPDEPSQVSRKKKPKDWDDMTVVWTSENGLARAPRPKRTMTEEERREYQLRRVRGACVSCKKRKRKCTHDPPRFTNVPKDDRRPPPKPDPSSNGGVQSRRTLSAEGKHQKSFSKVPESGASKSGDSTQHIPQQHNSSLYAMFNVISPHIATAKEMFHEAGKSATTAREMTMRDMPDMSSDSWSSPGTQSASLPESSQGGQSPLSSISARSPPDGGSLNTNAMYGNNWIDTIFEVEDQIPLDSVGFDGVKTLASPPPTSFAGEAWPTNDFSVPWWPDSFSPSHPSHLVPPEPQDNSAIMPDSAKLRYQPGLPYTDSGFQDNFQTGHFYAPSNLDVFLEPDQQRSASFSALATAFDQDFRRRYSGPQLQKNADGKGFDTEQEDNAVSFDSVGNFAGLEDDDEEDDDEEEDDEEEDEEEEAGAQQDWCSAGLMPEQTNSSPKASSGLRLESLHENWNLDFASEHLSGMLDSEMLENFDYDQPGSSMGPPVPVLAGASLSDLYNSDQVPSAQTPIPVPLHMGMDHRTYTLSHSTSTNYTRSQDTPATALSLSVSPSPLSVPGRRTSTVAFAPSRQLNVISRGSVDERTMTTGKGVRHFAANPELSDDTEEEQSADKTSLVSVPSISSTDSSTPAVYTSIAKKKRVHRATRGLKKRKATENIDPASILLQPSVPVSGIASPVSSSLDFLAAVETSPKDPVAAYNPPSKRIVNKSTDVFQDNEKAQVVEESQIKLRQKKKMRRQSRGSIGKRTLAQEVGSDTSDDEEVELWVDIDVGATARRLRRRTSGRKRLIFEDDDELILDLDDSQAVEASIHETFPPAWIDLPMIDIPPPTQPNPASMTDQAHPLPRMQSTVEAPDSTAVSPDNGDEYDYKPNSHGTHTPFDTYDPTISDDHAPSPDFAHMRAIERQRALVEKPLAFLPGSNRLQSSNVKESRPTLRSVVRSSPTEQSRKSVSSLPRASGVSPSDFYRKKLAKKKPSKIVDREPSKTVNTESLRDEDATGTNLVFPKAELPAKNDSSDEIDGTCHQFFGESVPVPSIYKLTAGLVKSDSKERGVFEMDGNMPSRQGADGRSAAEKSKSLLSGSSGVERPALKRRMNSSRNWRQEMETSKTSNYELYDPTASNNFAPSLGAPTTLDYRSLQSASVREGRQVAHAEQLLTSSHSRSSLLQSSKKKTGLREVVQTRIFDSSQKSVSSISSSFRNIVKKVAKTKAGPESPAKRLSPSSLASSAPSAMPSISLSTLSSPIESGPQPRASARFSRSRKRGKESDKTYESPEIAQQSKKWSSAAGSINSRFSASEDEGLRPRPSLQMSSSTEFTEVYGEVGYRGSTRGNTIGPIDEMDEPSYSNHPSFSSYSQQRAAMPLYALQSTYESPAPAPKVEHEMDDKILSGLSRMTID